MPLAGTGARSCNNGNRLDKYLALPRPTGKHILRTGSPPPLLPLVPKGTGKRERKKKKETKEIQRINGPITRNETTLSSGNEETIMPSPYVPRPNETIMGRGEFHARGKNSSSNGRRSREGMEKRRYEIGRLICVRTIMRTDNR